MNRIDRQNLTALTSSITHDEPVGLNLATGMPETNDYRVGGVAPADARVPNGDRIIEPKPGSKFAAEENFGTVPVTMNSHGDFVEQDGAGQPDAGILRVGAPATGQVIAPKPGSKFAAAPGVDERDECGAMPVPMPADGAQTPADIRPASPDTASRRAEASVPDDITMANGESVIMPKPGSKFAA